MNAACPKCGHRQDSGDVCGNCKHDIMYDLTKPRDVIALRDIERKLRDKRIDRIRKLSVAISMGAVFALWLVPGFWWARRQFFAIPLLLDQLGLIVLIAFGMTKLLESRSMKPRFPYLDAE